MRYADRCLALAGGRLQKFRGQAVGVLDDLDIEARRILEWIPP